MTRSVRSVEISTSVDQIISMFSDQVSEKRKLLFFINLLVFCRNWKKALEGWKELQTNLHILTAAALSENKPWFVAQHSNLLSAAAVAKLVKCHKLRSLVKVLLS